ncbi:hypothetical protein H6P81_016082 [Aristolochia fimbriata]|uniref:Uncharacterized protein n=1 Tax=Aristolochia fimbriata TaxID=158543 RepID=A0AAV7E7C1_ARIFI|nr:hypothetical protein H6P81_016082 [Aristolochia fimbriata]
MADLLIESGAHNRTRAIKAKSGELMRILEPVVPPIGPKRWNAAQLKHVANLRVVNLRARSQGPKSGPRRACAGETRRLVSFTPTKWSKAVAAFSPAALPPSLATENCHHRKSPPPVGNRWRN